MNVFLWILQILFALHTAMGGLWKFTNPAAAVPSLTAIPQGVWLALGVLDLLATVGLFAPLFNKAWSKWAGAAALFVVVEMLLFCIVSLSTGTARAGELAYWIVVALVAAFIAWSKIRTEV